MTPGPRFNSRQRWYTLDLAFVQRHIPRVLCPPACTHNPCLPPVVYLLFVDPRGPGRPKISDDEARAIIADAIHALQRIGAPITQEAVIQQAGWPSSANPGPRPGRIVLGDPDREPLRNSGGVVWMWRTGVATLGAFC
jgi:hypothetical protein